MLYFIFKYSRSWQQSWSQWIVSKIDALASRARKRLHWSVTISYWISTDCGLNLSLGVEASKSNCLLKYFHNKIKSTSLVYNPNPMMKLLHADKKLAATKFKSHKEGNCCSSCHATSKYEITRKFQSFKQFDTLLVTLLTITIFVKIPRWSL